MKKALIIITIAVLLTGCGDNKSVSSVNSISENNSPEISEKVELYSDDTKIVYKQSKGSYLVFYYDGNKIIGYELYLDYEDEETASVAYEVLKQDHSAYNNVKNINQKGQYVVIEYNENEYAAYSLDDVKRTYSTLEQVQKNS